MSIVDLVCDNYSHTSLLFDVYYRGSGQCDNYPHTSLLFDVYFSGSGQCDNYPIYPYCLMCISVAVVSVTTTPYILIV